MTEMATQPPLPTPPRAVPWRSAARIAIIYAGFAATWILLSDKAVEWLFATPAQITTASVIKGWLFVAVTTALLFAEVRRLLDRLVQAAEIERRALAERARAQELVDAIANASPDSIFAKDLQGHYLVWNREVARAVGQAPHVGRTFDDRDLFPADQTSIEHQELAKSTPNLCGSSDGPHGRRGVPK